MDAVGSCLIGMQVILVVQALLYGIDAPMFVGVMVGLDLFVAVSISIGFTFCREYWMLVCL